jgi:hypothetical protein
MQFILFFLYFSIFIFILLFVFSLSPHDSNLMFVETDGQSTDEGQGCGQTQVRRGASVDCREGGNGEETKDLGLGIIEGRMRYYNGRIQWDEWLP